MGRNKTSFGTDTFKENPLMIKGSQGFSDVDGSVVTIKNWMFHTYYRISIFPMNE